MFKRDRDNRIYHQRVKLQESKTWAARNPTSKPTTHKKYIFQSKRDNSRDAAPELLYLLQTNKGEYLHGKRNRDNQIHERIKLQEQ